MTVSTEGAQSNIPFFGGKHKVRWFNHWDPLLDEVLRSLPEWDDFPVELYRRIAQNPCSYTKRIGLMTDDGEPVSIIAIRKESHHWVPVTQWVIPGPGIPAKAEDIPRVVDRLGIDFWLAWWRVWMPPLQCKTLRYRASTPTHRIACTANFEEYWRSSGNFKAVRLHRNRCKKFMFGVNLPGALEWTLQNWARRWFGKESTFDISDHLEAAQFLSGTGRYYAFTLSDESGFICGATMLVHRNDLVAGVNYRKLEYNWYGIGDYLLDKIFYWAGNTKYSEIDLGGGQAYKARWAPQAGERWLYHLCPTHLYLAKKALELGRRMKSAFRTNGVATREANSLSAQTHE